MLQSIFNLTWCQCVLIHHHHHHQEIACRTICSTGLQESHIYKELLLLSTRFKKVGSFMKIEDRRRCISWYQMQTWYQNHPTRLNIHNQDKRSSEMLMCSEWIGWCQLWNKHIVSPFCWFWRARMCFLPAVNVLLRHAVHLLSVNKAGPVRLRNPKGRVVLEACKDVGAEILPLVQEPNNGWDSHNGDHADDDQNGQQQAGLWAGNSVRRISWQLCAIQRLGFKFHLLCFTLSATERQRHPVRKRNTIQTQSSDVTSSER